VSPYIWAYTAPTLILIELPSLFFFFFQACFHALIV
jgi:hypothetical protein